MASGNKFDELRKKFSADGAGNPAVGSRPPPQGAKNVNLAATGQVGGRGGVTRGGGRGVTRGGRGGGGGAFGNRGNSSNSTGTKFSSSHSQPILPSLPSRTLSQSSSSSDISDIPPVSSSVAGYSKKALPARITSQPHANFHQSEAHIEEDDMYNVPDEEPSMNGGEPDDDLYIVDLDLDNDAVVNFPSMFYLARNSSRMGFGSELQSKTAHDAILRLNDQELRLMDTLKRVVSHRMRADKDYATALQGIGNLATKFDTDAQLSHNNSPLLKAWNHLIEETDRICKLVRSNADEVQNIVEKLALLIKDKHDSKRQYTQERTRIDSEFMKARREVDENLSTYKKSAREARESKSKYEEQLQKGNKVKDIDRSKEKYKKCVIKLHKAHNDYVLSLRAAGLHQEHYRNNILPRLLECLQQTQESQVAQIKQVMVEHCNLINSASGKFLSHYNSIMQNMVEIRPEKEYSSFVENYRMEPPAMETFTFDLSPSEDFPDGLKENTIVLDTLTIEAIQHSHSSLDEQLKNTRDRLTAKKQELKNLDEEIRTIPPSPKEEGAILDLLSKQKQYRDASREIQELRCQEAKLSTQYSMLDVKLSEMGDEDNLPLGIIFPEGGGTGTLSTRTIQSPNLNSSTDSTTEQKSKRSNMANKMTKIFKVRAGHDSSHEPSNNQPTELRLEEEEFYHGALPRKETEALLVNDGDFVVREKSDAWGRYVLSAKHASKVRHFPIQINDENMYRLEGDAFQTVGELIRFQLNSRQPVTKASQAILLKPVCRVRNEHDLRHEEIDLEEKLGAGHFGDVHRGRIKRTQLAVAVKTCKETVDAATRRKFLQEANILKQYDHANIVKLIGVCTDKHPIYIVMELVPGGDLLSFLRTDQNELSTKQRVKMGEDAASGMAYLESKQCIHRDLAARNCLVGNKNVIKISDFGMSREDDVYTIREGAMRQIPIKWTAPEAMNFGKYTSMSDVWSFGILLWEIFSNGSTPYPGMTNNEAREKVQQGYRMPPPEITPEEVRILMDNCWKMVDEDRPRFKDAQTTLKRAYKTVR
ncbi:tyrosine-protein kinase Fer isoform X3 [Strongylocentrotus purpuratus]|uniref:Tyrosine-protein kinase n=1 Tax=Strongylocentrotus purpuratus TaxID=7668 RepID=A0A7M7MZY1_STRPU|nr:tyrosine-protein kinase Fer isoform X3 [Strongylocentrotus purpuratus]